VLLSMPSVLHQFHPPPPSPKLFGSSGLTIYHDEEVNTQHSKPFPDLVVGVLEFSLHYSSVDFYDDYARKACEDHSCCSVNSVLLCHEGCLVRGRREEVILSTTPLVGEKLGGDGI